MTDIHSAREAAARALFAVREEGAWSAPALRKYAAGLSARDAALATALTGGVLQNRAMCDFYLAHFSAVKLKKLQQIYLLCVIIKSNITHTNLLLKTI